MKPDSSRSLHGRLRRQEAGAKGAVEVKPDVVNDPFAEIKNVAQREAVHELGQALIDGEVPEEELRDHVQKAVDVALAEAGTPLSSADDSRVLLDDSCPSVDVLAGEHPAVCLPVVLIGPSLQCGDHIGTEVHLTMPRRAS